MKWNVRWHVKGRKNGVTVIEGDSDVPSPWIYRIMFGLAGIEAVIGVGALIYEMVASPGSAHGFDHGFFIAACVHGGVGQWVYAMRKRMLFLVPQEEMSHWLGVEPAQVDAIIIERGIKPAYLVNGRPFYNRADFEQGALLRASTAPDAVEELLRPAHDEAEPVELLLRASQASTEPLIKTTQQAEEPLYQQVHRA